jgi:hypothetical protein
MTAEPSEARQVHPFSKPIGDSPGFKDFSPNVEKVSFHPTEEKAEVDEALTPTPKDSSAQESAISSESETVPPKSEIPALPDHVTPTEKLEAAVKASGKDSEPNEEEQTDQSQTTQEAENSSPDSSSEKSPGKSTPPVVAKPPTANKTPTP